MPTRNLTLGHSPDPDDAFMFYALATGKIPTPGLAFEHILQDIQTLNQRALKGELDITAISFHAYPYLSGDYDLLPSGASMGDGYGPMVIARKALTKEEVATKKIAIPGKLTSAYLAFQFWLGRSGEELNCVVVPFDQIFETVLSGQAEAGLIIHEGQLTFRSLGLELCQDLGAWWSQKNEGLPLPLGGNVAHKRLGKELQSEVARIISSSIQYALNHRAEAVEYSLRFARDLNRQLADQFVGMYVNHWTLDYKEAGRESIRRFLRQGSEAGLVPEVSEIEFVR